jgi:hypothetical protein
LSNSLLETECTDAFQQSINSLFGVAALSSDKVSQFSAGLVIKQAETEVEGRIEPEPRMKVSMPDFLQSESRFTPSEILLQQLASKCAWTEADIAQFIDLLRSPQYDVDDIGLDLSRKVNLFHTISYYFIPYIQFHTISYYFIISNNVFHTYSYFYNVFHIIFRNASLLFRHFRTKTMS